MSLAKRLEALRERAQREVFALDDDAVLSSRHAVLPVEVAEHHYLAPVRLGSATFDSPRAIKMAVAGEPGREAPGGAPSWCRARGSICTSRWRAARRSPSCTKKTTSSNTRASRSTSRTTAS